MTVRADVEKRFKITFDPSEPTCPVLLDEIFQIIASKYLSVDWLGTFAGDCPTDKCDSGFSIQQKSNNSLYVRVGQRTCLQGKADLQNRS